MRQTVSPHAFAGNTTARSLPSRQGVAAITPFSVYPRLEAQVVRVGTRIMAVLGQPVAHETAVNVISADGM